MLNQQWVNTGYGLTGEITICVVLLVIGGGGDGAGDTACVLGVSGAPRGQRV